MKARWQASDGTVYDVGYLLVWCTKYRRPLLEGKIESRLRELLFERAQELGISIEGMEIMPDHVNLSVSSPPVHAPHFIIQQLKGHTSRILRREFGTVRSRVPTLWTRSYWCASFGRPSASRKIEVQKYLEEQKEH